MSAEKSYDLFSGFRQPQAGNTGAHSTQLGSKLKPINWDQQQPSNEWRVVNIKAMQEKAKEKEHREQAAKVEPLPKAEAEKWRAEHSITVFASDCPPPISRFDMLTNMIPSSVQKKFAQEGFQAPTPVQAQSWPILFAQRDIVGIAKTGSGKTLAFIVPAIAHILARPHLENGDGPICVVLAPTRELAQQIEAETRKVLPTELRCACIYGGTPKGPQLQMLRQGVHILVATPGRLIDLLEIRRLNLLRVTYLVLDEADRMLDMGFEPQVRAICSQIRPERQTLMFSATWPREIQQLATQFQHDFVRIHVGSTELLANPDVEQRFVLTQEANKFEELKKIMNAHKNQRVLVFCKTKRTADQLEYQLKRLNYDVMAIHGDKEQRQREFILERFRRDSRLCVVATDVASRGLDIKHLEVVVNYDFPMQIDDYVHRIGRTGRAGAKGLSITMITKFEAQLTAPVVKTLVGIIEKAKHEVPAWLREWSEQFRCAIAKRGRTDRFGERRGTPSLHYSHSNRPSFDPSAGSKTFFGLAGGSPAAVFGSHQPPPHHPPPHQPPNRGHMKFHDSDDEELPNKKPRNESS